jgi:hypothetical protein
VGEKHIKVRALYTLLSLVCGAQSDFQANLYNKRNSFFEHNPSFPNYTTLGFHDYLMVQLLSFRFDFDISARGTSVRCLESNAYRAAIFVTGQVLERSISTQGRSRQCGNSLGIGEPLVAEFLDEFLEILGASRTVRVRKRLGACTILTVNPVQDGSENLRNVTD